VAGAREAICQGLQRGDEPNAAGSQNASD